jgi:hypothetical protein
MKKQIVTIVLGAVVMLGTATTLFAQNGPSTGGYPPVMGGAGGNPAVPGFAYFPEGRTSYVTSGIANPQPTKHHRRIYLSAKSRQ